MADSNHTLGRAIGIARQARGYHKGHLAKRVGCSSSTISLIESGRRSPSTDSLRAIASALAIDLPLLYHLAGFSDSLSSLAQRTLNEALGEWILRASEQAQGGLHGNG